jgi:hypothetical protein
MPKKSLAPVQEVLKYQNPRLVKYFAEEHGLSTVESKTLFNDLKKWLWLCANRDANADVMFFNDLRVLDLYWHTFLSFTRDYVEFCERYLGGIVYHEPEPHIVARKQAKNPNTALAKNLKVARSSIAEVVRLLGNQQAKRWFVELPEQYGARFAKRFN